MKVAPGEERSAEAISLELLRMAASSPRSACDRQEMVRLIEEFASALGVRDLASALNKSAAPAPDTSSPEFASALNKSAAPAPDASSPEFETVRAPEPVADGPAPPLTPSQRRWSRLRVAALMTDTTSGHHRSSRPSGSRPRFNSALHGGRLDFKGANSAFHVGLLVALVAFFAFGVLYFSLAEGFTVIDSLYFTVVVLTTVGYGDADLLCTSARAKIVICCFVLYAMLLAAQALGILANAAFKKAEEIAAARAAENKKLQQMARQGAQRALGSHEEAKRRRAQARQRERDGKRLKAVLSTCAVVLVGTVYYAADPLEHKAWVDAFYMCVMTVTTVGFGDFSPSSARGRVFAGAVCVLVRRGVRAPPSSDE